MKFHLFFKAFPSAPAENIGLTIGFSSVSIGNREDKENFESLAILKSACRLISFAYHSFRVSVDKKFLPNGFNRELIFSFFCTCAELAVVSRQKDKAYRVRFLSDTNFSLIQYGLLIVFRYPSALSQNK